MPDRRLRDHAHADTDTDIDTDESDDEGIADDDDQYAPLLGRYNWHIHVPGLRGLWEWRLYPVRRRRRRRQHQLRRSQEKWEWDYPLSRWRSKVLVMLEAAWRFFSSILLRNNKKKGGAGTGRQRDVVVVEYENNGGVYRYTEDGSDCLSEDERARKEAREMEHRERVEGRREWLAGIGHFMGSFFGVGSKERDRDSVIVIEVRGSHSQQVRESAERSGVSSVIGAFRRRRRSVVDEEMVAEVAGT
jgi:hypothetical protein